VCALSEHITHASIGVRASLTTGRLELFLLDEHRGVLDGGSGGELVH
jgi:hypothetical protein